MPERQKNQSGQALLLILLAMAALATVVLSIASRSVTEVDIATREEESLRAFSAAEAGVEQALVSVSVTESADEGPQLTGQLSVTGSVGTDVISEYEAQVSGYPDQSDEFIYPLELLSGDTANIWLTTKDGDDYPNCSENAPCFLGSDIKLCWGEGDSERPAIEVSFLHEGNSSGDLEITRANYDPLSRSPDNKFITAGGNCTIAGKSFRDSAEIDLSSSGLDLPQNSYSPSRNRLILMRVKMLYNESEPKELAVTSSSSNFPTQGKQVSSEGTSGDSTRRINAYLLTPVMPSIFDSVIYTPVSISK